MDKKLLAQLGITQEQVDQANHKHERNQLYDVFVLFSQFAEKHNERYLEIRLGRDGAGSINRSGEPGCNEWLAWRDLDEAPGKLREAIQKWEKEIAAGEWG